MSNRFLQLIYIVNFGGIVGIAWFESYGIHVFFYYLNFIIVVMINYYKASFS